MRQSEFKRRYDVKTGRYVKKHIYGEGVTDVFKTIGRKLFGKTMKEAAKTATKKAVQKAATKTGEYAGEKAGDKIVQLLRASLCKILISSFAHKMDFAHNFSVDFF